MNDRNALSDCKSLKAPHSRQGEGEADSKGIGEQYDRKVNLGDKTYFLFAPSIVPFALSRSATIQDSLLLTPPPSDKYADGWARGDV
jgi:hypothetical protein